MSRGKSISIRTALAPLAQGSNTLTVPPITPTGTPNAPNAPNTSTNEDGNSTGDGGGVGQVNPPNGVVGGASADAWRGVVAAVVLGGAVVFGF